MLRTFCVAISLFIFLPVSMAGERLSMRLLADPETLDWNLAHTMVETHVLMNLMEGLVELDTDLKPRPALAERWRVSPDGRTYTFFLREGVRWSDGVLLKAQDFEFSWRRLLDPKTAAPYAYFLFDIEGAEDFNKGKLTDFSKVAIRALDDRTFEVRLKKPISHWIQIPTFWVTFPLRRDLVEKYGRAWTKPGNMATVGPLVLESYQVDSKIVLRKNPHYARPFGNLDSVEVYIVRDDSTAFHLYESGKLQFLTDISTITLSKIRSRPDLKAFPYLKLVYLGFVTALDPASKVGLRKAIARAIDKTRIEHFLHGGQKPAASLAPPPLLGSSSEIGLKYDPKRAALELKLSGIKPESVKGMQILAVNNDKSLAVAQFVQQEIHKNLGIEVGIQSFDSKTYFKERALRRFPSFISSWGADYPDVDNFVSIFLGGAGNNHTGWKNPRYDQYVLDARSEMNAHKKAKLSLSAQRILQEDEVVVVPLYYEPNLVLVRPEIQGLELNPMNVLNLRGVRIVR